MVTLFGFPLRMYLDPDRRWFSADKFQHAGSHLILAFLMRLCGLSFWGTMGIDFWGGLMYEAGQTDTAYGTTKYYPDNHLLGRVGFGISPLDLAWNTAGALVGNLLYTWLATL